MIRFEEGISNLMNLYDMKMNVTRKKNVIINEWVKDCNMIKGKGFVFFFFLIKLRN